VPETENALDEAQEQRVHRQVALLGDAFEDAPILAVVEVVLAATDVEEAVTPQAVRLVHLEVEDEARHRTLGLVLGVVVVAASNSA
jgi:3-deoxy-D-manno-octulosonate 8-phosphate phosphatase KdsC-like HAD superfamily phosphatase